MRLAVPGAWLFLAPTGPLRRSALRLLGLYGTTWRLGAKLQRALVSEIVGYPRDRGQPEQQSHARRNRNLQYGRPRRRLVPCRSNSPPTSAILRELAVEIRMNSASIFDLSPSEKLQLVEDLWDDLAAAPEAVPVHDWQKQELARRKANLLKNPASGLPWEEVKRKVRARYAR